MHGSLQKWLLLPLLFALLAIPIPGNFVVLEGKAFAETQFQECGVRGIKNTKFNIPRNT